MRVFSRVSVVVFICIITASNLSVYTIKYQSFYVSGADDYFVTYDLKVIISQ